MSRKYVTYRLWDGCEAPANLELNWRLVGQLVPEASGPCDRAALLALADEMEGFGGEHYRKLREMGVVVDSWAACARRIREACGEEGAHET